MQDRTKLLVHARRIPSLFSGAISNGPDGTLEGKFAEEHPTFTHHLVSFYLAGSLAYLEGEDGAYSWNAASQTHADFDAFATSHPLAPKQSYSARGICRANLDALAQIRNAVVHNNGDLARNSKSNALAMAQAANLPGVNIVGSCVKLEGDLMEYIRVSTLAVRNYFGDQ